MNFLLFSLLLSLSATEALPHAFYLAVVQLDHAAGGATARVTVKVFTDDLQDALRNAFPDEFRPVTTDAFCERLGEQAGRYFARHFTCTINGEERPMTLQRCELQNDVYLLQFELACPADWRELRVKADFFMELFPSQTNVLSILHGEEKGYFRLTKGAEACTVAF